MVNSQKVLFVLIAVIGSALVLVDAEVPTFEQRTSPDPPLLVGVPILHSLPTASAVAPRVAKLLRVYHRTRDPDIAPALQLRAFSAYALGSLDYLMQGVLLQIQDLKAAQVIVNKAHRAALGAPKWTHLALLQLPLAQGGAGAADLGSRAALLLAVSYMTVSLGRNVLGRAAVLSLVRGGHPYCEFLALSARLAPFSLHLLPVCSSLEIREAPVVLAGSPAVLQTLDWCLAATDGSVTGLRVGAAFALWHPAHGVFYSASVGCWAVAAHSTDAEWLARILLASQLKRWKGTLLVASDSTGASPHGLTRAPRSGTVLEALFRTVCKSPAFISATDIWLPAQHDSGARGVLADLNAEADRLASEAAQRSRPFELPLKPFLLGRVVGVAGGAFCLSPSKACARLYTDQMTTRFLKAFPSTDPLWSARAFAQILLATHTLSPQGDIAPDPPSARSPRWPGSGAPSSAALPGCGFGGFRRMTVSAPNSSSLVSLGNLVNSGSFSSISGEPSFVQNRRISSSYSV